MTPRTPEQMRALADAIDWPSIPGEPNTATPEALSNAATTLRYAAAELEALRRPQTIVINDPVAGRIEQRVRPRDGSPSHLSDNQMARFAEIAKQFPTSAAIAQAWDEGFEAGATWPQHTASGIPVDPPMNPYDMKAQ